MKADAELLQLYLGEDSQAAFTELVQRHLGLVHSVALRRVGGDAHLAEDVAQLVFADLARKATTLRDRTTLAGWLYQAAHLTSAAVVRREQRRKIREAAVDLMPENPDLDWTRLRPVIDDAMVALDENDREAIALRFFERCSFAEVGAALRVSEDAARKRVDRALERLHPLLSARGVTSSAAALGVALAAASPLSVSPALSVKVAQEALTQASTAGAGVFTISLLPAVVALVIGGLLIDAQRRQYEQLQVEAVQLSEAVAALPALRAENTRLAQAIAVLELPAERAMQDQRPSSPAETVPRPVSARVKLSSTGSITWDNDPVSVQAFIDRIKAHRATADPESRINVRAVGVPLSTLAYVVEELRKGDVHHLTVESNAKPDAAQPIDWF